MFEWTHLGTAITDAPRTAYRLNGVEVARLWQTVSADRRWFASLDMHLPYERRSEARPCTDFARGQSGVEAWAERHRERLQPQLAAIEAARPCRSWLPSISRNG